MKQNYIDEKYMARCLQLAKNGRLLAKPNPMVGAVIVSEHGRIIGEGYHIEAGKPHAEVNAFSSVKVEDEHLLKKSTLYVSLEPCSHYGKTPPCAELIIRKRVRRVVCGCIDPFEKVQGRGIMQLREAGIEVKVGVLEKKCSYINRQFFIRNIYKRPYIILKWAQTQNHKIAYENTNKDNYKRLFISNEFTKMLVHKLRSENDAILIGRITEQLEHPKLTVREWSGNNPIKLLLSSAQNDNYITLQSIADIFKLVELSSLPIYSIVVEGGRSTLNSFIKANLWDEIRVETAPFYISHGINAPQIPSDAILYKKEYWNNSISIYLRNYL